MKSIFKTILFISLFVVVQQSLFAQDDNKTVVIKVSGSGKTQDEAKQSALRSAIEQAFGTFISANTEILNDKLVSDQITSVANGNIQSFTLLNELQLPDGSWGVTLKAIVSVSKLTSFVQSKGIAVEIKGGMFALNIKQQLLNEQGEIKAVYDLVSLLHEPLQIAFDYKLKTSNPQSIDAQSKNWKIPLQVIATANKNMDFCANYFINTLKALSLSSEEVENYRRLNKVIFPVKINYKSVEKTIYLRKIESVKMLNFIIDNWIFYTSQFKVDSGLDEISVLKFFSKFEKESEWEKDMVGKNYLNYFLNKNKNTEYNLNTYRFNPKYEYDRTNDVYFNFLTDGQRAATYDWHDKRTLSQIEQMTGYEVKSSGGGSKIKYGGLVISEKHGNIVVMSLIDIGSSDWYTAKKACEGFVIGSYNDWRLPTIEELKIIHSTLKEEGVGGFGNFYWSDSLDSSSDAEYYVFQFGQKDKITKEYKSYNVRPVRTIR